MIFFCDIDGTLIKNDIPLPESVISAAEVFTKSGGLLSLCTGRSLSAVRAIAEKLPVNAPCIVFCGAAIYDFKTGGYLWHHPFDKQIIDCCEKLYKEIESVSLQIYTLDQIFICRTNRILETKGIPEERNGIECHPSSVSGELMKLVLACEDTECLASCKDFFPAEKFDFAFSSRHFAEVTPAGASKLDSGTRLADMLGHGLDSCAAAGDGQTDLPLLKKVLVSYAPCSAPAEICAQVKRVVSSVAEGGMSAAFLHATELMKGMNAFV